ncbi:hypothetical protein HKD37_01G001101 [Glycine soja]
MVSSLLPSCPPYVVPLTLVPLPTPPFQQIRSGGSPHKGKGSKQECVCGGLCGIDSEPYSGDNAFRSWNQKFSVELGQHARHVMIEVKLRDWDSRGNKIVNFTIRVVGSSPMPP